MSQRSSLAALDLPHPSPFNQLGAPVTCCRKVGRNSLVRGWFHVQGRRPLPADVEALDRADLGSADACEFELLDNDGQHRTSLCNGLGVLEV
jgi:hypothetical protein